MTNLELKMDSQESDRSGTGNYSLEVENFGPIVSANVEFRPLTVFVGPSNTGKSYLAILVYALHRCFGSYGFRRHRRFPGYRFGPFAIDSIKLNKSTRTSLAAWLSTFREEESMPPLPEDVVARFRPVLEAPVGLDRNLDKEMLRCFGVENHDELVRRSGTHASTRVGLNIPQDSSAEPVRYEFTFGQGRTQLAGTIADASIAIEAAPPEYLEEMSFGFREAMDQADLMERERTYVVRVLADSLFSSLVRPLTPDAFYLPASRTGVMHSHQALAGC